MRVLWDDHAWQDYRYWQRADAGIAARIDRLIADIARHPFTGLGNPEPLKFALAGFWSRRISGEHRLVYRVTGKPARLEIIQCRYHY